LISIPQLCHKHPTWFKAWPNLFPSPMEVSETFDMSGSPDTPIGQTQKPRSAWRKWSWLLLPFLAFALSVGIRLLDLRDWHSPEFWVSGERLAASADSYGWYAGAERINHLSDDVLPGLLRWLHDGAGWNIGNIGFWLPAALGPLSAVPVCLLALAWGVPEGALLTGVLGGAAVPFLVRTRLGALDMDVLTLFFPLTIASLLLLWMESSGEGLCPSSSDSCHQDLQIATQHENSVSAKTAQAGFLAGSERFFVLALVTGLTAKVYLLFYPGGLPILASLLGCAGALVLFPWSAERALVCVTGLLAISALGIGGWVAFALAAAIMICGALRPQSFSQRKSPVIFLVLLLLVLMLDSDLPGKVSQAWSDVLRYGRRSEPHASLHVPPTILTVSEAILVNLNYTVKMLAGNWVLFTLGLTGYFYLVRQRPRVLIFLPLLVLGMASIKFGVRFSMYGGCVIGLGLGCGLALMMRDLRVPPTLRWVLPTVLLVFFLWEMVAAMNVFKPSPIVSKDYAQAFKEMRDSVAPDAQFWAWWDFGYPIQYFAERRTFADGSRNSGEYLAPLSRILTTDSPSYAKDLINFTAQAQAASGPERRPPTRIPLFPNPFLHLLHELEPARAQELIERPANSPRGPGGALPPQYVVVSWETVALAETITSFGAWNLVDGTYRGGRMFRLTHASPVDLEEGILEVEEKRMPVANLDVLSRAGNKHFEWPQNKTGWSILNNAENQMTLVVEDRIYYSLMVQMLIADPEKLRPYFDLIIDRSPFVRIFRVNDNDGDWKGH
jgi:undecaprenyl-diphosphooligosaccharide---protein glycotransferase